MPRVIAASNAARAGPFAMLEDSQYVDGREFGYISGPRGAWC